MPVERSSNLENLALNEILYNPADPASKPENGDEELYVRSHRIIAKSQIILRKYRALDAQLRTYFTERDRV